MEPGCRTICVMSSLISCVAIAPLLGWPARGCWLWMGLSPRKFHRWKGRYGKANEHNAMIPRDHWIDFAGAGSHRGVCSPLSFGRLPPAHFHDARSRPGSGQSRHHLFGCSKRPA